MILPPKPEQFAWQGAARFSRDYSSSNNNNNGCSNALNANKISRGSNKRSSNASGITSSLLLSDYMVTKQEYLEYGHHYCNEKFNNGW